ncbi:DUF3800 domain-containing protein [Leifsonia sp. P73]|uniref:DUF3800 domain-containing protein n=1 Tax=Leifsonia sp. P73 TaxID=3423959 RepID=UPI003DA58992
MNDIAGLVSAHVPSFDPRAEFHAVDMFHGRRDWRAVPLAWRVKACDLVAKVLARSTVAYVFRGVDLVALSSRYRRPHPPISSRSRTRSLRSSVSSRHDQDALGLVLADEHHAATGARRSLRDFKSAAAPGYTTDALHCIADTIYFGPSHESRLLQAADVATFFVNRARTIEERDPRSRRAVAKIVANVRSITLTEYVWCP